MKLENGSSNFHIVDNKKIPWVYKVIPEPIQPILEERLKREATAISIVGEYFPDLVPKVFSYPGILSVERLNNVGQVGFSDIAGVIEKLQGIPLDPRLPLNRLDDYYQQAGEMMSDLRVKGITHGLSQREVELIQVQYDASIHSLDVFAAVFVHKDTQKKHFGRRDGRVVIFDFDQAQFGNELQDWAFLSVRHPFYSYWVRQRLVTKYQDDFSKSNNLREAFELMQTHEWLRAYHNRTFQPRGGIKEGLMKLYGRVMLQDRE